MLNSNTHLDDFLISKKERSGLKDHYDVLAWAKKSLRFL